MRVKAEFTNLDEVTAAIAKRLEEIGGPMTERFMTVALGEISAHTAPYVPVDTSNLINSEYRQVRRTGAGWEGEIGFSAEYAVFVHEGGEKNWQKSGASDEFLLKGGNDFVRDSLSSVIAQVYR